MLVKEKISREKGDLISLYREGLFWKLYNVSAYNFSRLVKPYAVKKKYIKEIKEIVVSIGFPDVLLTGNLDKLKPFSSFVNVTENMIEIGLAEPLEGYQEWFDQQDIMPEKFPNPENKKEKKEEEISKNEHCNDTTSEQIIKELRSFPLMQKTPLEVQMFVLELQKKLSNS